MYDKIETDISWSHLRTVIENLEEPIVLIGGWAVFLHVNENYKNSTGREYIGSRDIDLGFSSNSDFERSPYKLTYDKLTEDLDFVPLSFGRLFKEMDRNTSETLSPETARTMPSFEIFQMYVDLIVDEITPEFEAFFGFTPIDEPLLEKVYEDEQNRTERNDFKKRLWLPSPDLLLSMKIKSHPNRDKEHKRVKDLSDITALIMYSGARPTHSNSIGIEKFKSNVDQKDVEAVGTVLGIETQTIYSALSQIKQ